MKKVASILGVLILSVGMFSCEADNNAAETDNLYDIEATDQDHNPNNTSRDDD